LIVSVLPAIVAVKICGPLLTFGGIVTVTMPLPVPFTGVTPRPDAAHVQDARDGVTVICADPPAADTVSFDGLMANEQALPNCVTMCCWPPTVKVSWRAPAPVFGTTE
jgi:hypothetical protein